MKTKSASGGRQGSARMLLGLFFGTALLCVVGFCATTALARRGDEKGCKCSVNVEVINETCVFEFDGTALKAVKKESEFRKLADDLIAKCRDEFHRCWAADTRRVRREAINAFKAIQAGPEAGFTIHSAPSVIDYEVVCLVEDGFGGEVKILLCNPTIQLVPKDAPDKLKAHEKGHVKIQDDYCTFLSKFLESEIKKIICSKKYESEDELDKAIRKLIADKTDEFMKKGGVLGPYADWQEKYNTATKDGTDGDQAKEAEKISKEMSDKIPK